MKKLFIFGLLLLLASCARLEYALTGVSLEGCGSSYGEALEEPVYYPYYTYKYNPYYPSYYTPYYTDSFRYYRFKWDYRYDYPTCLINCNQYDPYEHTYEDRH